MVLLSSVYAEIYIVKPFGKPEITSISYSVSKIKIVIKNIADKDIGNFDITTNCGNEWYAEHTENIQIDAGQTKEITINLICDAGERCFKTIICEVKVEDEWGSFISEGEMADYKNITFQAINPNLCGTQTAVCGIGGKRCSDDKGQIEICNQYCSGFNYFEMCYAGESCQWDTEIQPASYRCVNLEKRISEISENTMRTNSSIFLTFCFLVAIVVIILLMKSKYKHKSKLGKSIKQKFCTNCGNKIKREDKFCHKCGNKL